MEVYDQAHALARSLRNSDAFRRLLQAEAALVKEPSNWTKLQDVRQKQMQITAQQMAGEQVDQKRIDALNNMMQALLMNSQIRDYLQAEERFAQLLADVQKIIGEVVQELKILTDNKGKEGV
ncbi:MAG: YlbF family regulator [bacterium]|jgi:cell fate (sporulation/competence/biofilm development) regulator YlbF (YheA/YmcA/DUF963 family)